MIEHTQRKHARLSASRADRFMACPGSVALESQMPYEPAGEAAAIGTHIHELSEMLLNASHTYDEIKASGVESDHLDMAQDYANFVNNLVENPRKRLIEVNVDEGLKSLHPSLGGTADAVLTESRTLHVIDLKTGRIPVSAKDNKQLLVYALGAARKLGAPADITVKMHIFQPRTGHSVAEISGNDLISFGHELKAAAEVMKEAGLRKVNPAAEFISDLLEAEGKVVVFAHHKDVVAQLADKLKAYSPVTITGDTPAKQRELHITAFQQDPDTKVIIGNIAAMSEGVDLSAADVVVFVEATWQTSALEQASSRVENISKQSFRPLIYLLTVRASLDHTVLGKVLQKLNIIDQII